MKVFAETEYQQIQNDLFDLTWVVLSLISSLIKRRSMGSMPKRMALTSRMSA